MADPKRSELVKATKELNKLLTPEPLMDTKAKGPALITKLNEAACLLEADDEVTKATQQTLVDIGAELPKGMLQQPKAKKKAEPKGKAKPKAEKKDAGKTETKPKAKAKPKTDPKAKAKSKVEKNKFGRRKGTNADFMDSMFIKGITTEKAVAAIVEAKDKTEPQALAAIKAHIRDFDKITTGFTLKTSSKGTHKAVAE